MALQHLRSSTANKRPAPGSMSDAQLAINTNLASPGLFFKDSNGDLVKVGPVHVGTTAPNVSPASGGTAGNSVGEQWLDTSSSRYVFKIWDGSAWRSEDGEFVNTSGDTMTGALGIIAGSAASPSLFISGDPNTGIYSPGADQVAISTNGAGRLFVDSSGNVGVGSTPGSRFAVTQNQAALSYLFDTYNTTSGGGSIWRMITRNLADTDTTSVDFYKPASFGFVIANNDTNSANFTAFNVGASERLRITSAGLVGIGTSSPNYRFEVAGNTGAPLASITQTDANASKLIFQPVNGANGAFINADWATGNGYLALGAAGEQVRITNGGRVGIGTTSPGNRLHVSGTGDVLRLDSTSTDSGILLFDSVGGARIGTRSANIIFDTTSLERARIDSSGRLLVGTSSARSSLGAIQVETAGTSDRSRYEAFTNINSSAGTHITLGKSRGTTAGSNTLVAASDEIGALNFHATDGSTDIRAAQIKAVVDGTPGANDMPGRLVFSVTADGASSPTEAMRIKNSKIINFANAPTYADNTAALAGGLVAGDVYRKSDGTLMITY